MPVLANLFRDFRRTSSDLPGLFSGDFHVMLLPMLPLFPAEKQICVPGYYSDQTYYCTLWKEYADPLAPYRCKKQLKAGRCMILEVNGLGSFVFTNHRRSNLFLNLQRKFPGVTSYVFASDGPGGYFKILKDGRIQRKIASYMWSDGMGSYAETRGVPCTYELETGHIFKVDPKAQHLREMMPDFTKREVLDLFDYYVGLDRFKSANLRRVLVYDLESAAAKK